MSKPVRAETGLERIELERLRDRMARLLTALQETIDGFALPPLPGAWTPPVDLCETEDAVTVRIELPGIAAEQIEVTLTNAQLRICGEKRRPARRRRALAHLCSERSYGSFCRVVPLQTWTIDVHAASAELQGGLLTVHLPKSAERRGRVFYVPIEEKNEG